MSKQLFPLRDYQAEALDVISADLKTEQFVLLQAIMGAGKTVTTARLINHYWYTTDRRFLVLAHKQELVEQFFKTFDKMTNIPTSEIGLCCAGLNRKDISQRLTIGTVQTFVSMSEQYQGCALLVVDECHRITVNNDSQYDAVINDLLKKQPNMRIVGITATPYRLGHGYCYGPRCKPGNRNLFPRLNHQVSYKRLLDEGYLMPLVGKVAAHEALELDMSSVKKNGDFVMDQAGEVMSREIHLQTAKQAIDEYCQSYNHICIFCCTIDHAEKLRDIIGDDCTTIHSQLTPLERQSNMNLWKSGVKRMVTSVNILVEGFDWPELDCLVFARPTMSSGLFLQAVGRVLRKAEMKERALLVDLTDNTKRFGVDIDNIKVTIPKVVEKEIKKELEDKDFKICPQCEHECHVAIRICEKCKYEWPARECVVASNLPDMEDVHFGEDVAKEKKYEWRDVEGVNIDIHGARSGKALGKIEFNISDNVFADERVTAWFCLPDFYTGYAVSKAAELWSKFSEEPLPKTVEEFYFEADRARMPSRIQVETSGKWPEITGYEFNTEKKKINDEDIPF